MKEIHYFFAPDAAIAQELPAEEALHAIRVLRMKEGDEMVLIDGKGTFYDAVLTLVTQRHCLYDIRQILPQQPTWKGHLHLAVAPTKMMERIEWLAEKATEVGLDELSFLNCQFSERTVVKTPRIEKIVTAAVKQSRKAWLPQVNGLTPFDTFLNTHTTGRRYIAHCYNEVSQINLFDELRRPSDDDDVLVMIGPEGDFSINEVRKALDAGFVSVDLGKSRLRTETAALSAVMMMHLAQQANII